MSLPAYTGVSPWCNVLYIWATEVVAEVEGHTCPQLPAVTHVYLISQFCPTVLKYAQCIGKLVNSSEDDYMII